MSIDEMFPVESQGAIVPAEREEKSWVIWLCDGLYTYAWGATPEEALAKYLVIWAKGIQKVVDANEYKDALPAHRYLHAPSNADWGFTPTALPGSALYDDAGKLREPK